MIIGVIITVCSNNWISMWIGLEISLLSFIPLIQTKNKIRSESIIKYFIIQRIASTMLLFGVVIMLVGANINNEIIITISILIKLGSSPFHNWVLLTIEIIDYFEIFIILTILKLPPLSILYQISSNKINLPIYIGIVIGSILALNQSSIRKLIGYSSIYNIRILLITTNKFNVTTTYLLIYSIIILIIITIIKTIKINFFNQIMLNEHNINTKINIWVNILSIAGFPPIIGFLIKLIVIQNLVLNEQLLIITVITFTSIIIIIFYTRITFSSLLSYSTQKKWSLNNSYKISYSIFILNFLLTPLIMTTFRIY